MRIKPILNKATLRVFAIAITAVMCTLVILSAVFPFPEGTWDFLSIGTSYQVSANPDWLSGWGQRVKLSIDADDVSSNLTDFPILLHLSTSSGYNAEDISFIFDELQSNANRFKIAVTKSDYVTQCYVEIEKWDDANEKADLWVKSPTVSSLSDTDFWLYFDADHANNTAYVGDIGSTPGQAVWDSSFKFVHHMANTNLESYKIANGIYTATAGQNYFLGEPCVLYLNSKFNLWMTVYNTSDSKFHIVYMYSTDGQTSWSSPVSILSNAAYARIFYNTDSSEYWLYAAEWNGLLPTGDIKLYRSSNPDSGFVYDCIAISHSTNSSAWDCGNGISKFTAWNELDDTTTDLTTSMDNSTTEMDVGDTTKFAVNQYIKLESEFMLVTAIISGTHCHVTRHQLGTSAVAHTQPKDVYKRTWYGMWSDGNSVTYKAGSGFATGYDGKSWTKYLPDNANPTLSVTGWDQASPNYAVPQFEDIPRLASDGSLYTIGFGIPNNFKGTTNWQQPTDCYLFKSQTSGTTMDKLSNPWTCVGGIANSWIARTLSWEGPGKTDSQTGDPWIIEQGDNLFIYYTGYKYQYGDPNISSSPMRLGLIYVPNQTFLGLIAATTGNMLDSTSNACNPDAESMQTGLATGKVGGARDFKPDGGTQYDAISINSVADITGTLTISAWVYFQGNGSDGSGGTVCGRRSAGKGYLLYIYSAANRGAYWEADASGFDSGVTFTQNAWKYLTFTRGAANDTIFVDTSNVKTRAKGTQTAVSCNFLIGTYTTPVTQQFNGLVDELRVSNIDRGAAWDKATYETTIDHLIDWGTQENATPTITNTPDSVDFGILEVNTTSNTVISYFVLNNTGNCPVDVTIQCTNFTGGDDTWTLSGTGTAGVNTIALHAGLDDDDDNFDVVVNTTASAFVADLLDGSTQAWGLNLTMPTSVSGYDAGQMSGTITLVASASS